MEKVTKEQWRKEQVAEEEWRALIKWKEDGEPPKDAAMKRWVKETEEKYAVVGGVLYRSEEREGEGCRW